MNTSFSWENIKNIWIKLEICRNGTKLVHPVINIGTKIASTNKLLSFRNGATWMEKASSLKGVGLNLSRQLEAIREISDCINSFQDSQSVYHIILDRLATHLEIDAAALFLLNPESNEFEFVADRGFRTSIIKHTYKNTPDCLAHRVIEAKEIYYLNDLYTLPERMGVRKLVQMEGFAGYMGVPLLSNGTCKGVFEIYHRHKITPNPGWRRFLRILAGQAVYLINRSDESKRYDEAVFLLDKTYNDALDGWVRAVELRDSYTFEHTERTTDLTLQLATRLGIPDEMLVHVMRGAMLHDIGKLVIPDTILQKHGPLNEEEWVIMRQHPVFAYKLLKPVQFLRPAITIPYYHHEKWDGSGYPHGLKKEEIPLEARIFSVVDVWDALTSNRPYRPAWREEEAISYIESNAEIEFDPDVVDEFLAIINQGRVITAQIEVDK
jgi:HD-GYP domain-containing protein (c-di-GMP phosphodiesterase class II)